MLKSPLTSVFKDLNRVETHPVVDCSNRDTSPRNLYIMTLVPHKSRLVQEWELRNCLLPRLVLQNATE